MNAHPGPARAPIPGEQAAAREEPVTLVLSRTVSAGDEHEFEEVLRQLVAEVRRQPGHLAVTVLEPAGAPAIYTIVSNFASQRDADAWLASPIRARLIAEADLYSSGALQTRHVSGLEAWLTSPGTPVLVPPARWRVIVVSALALLPLLEAISYLLAPRLAGLPVWSRSLISVAIVIPVMQYLVMPAATRATRGFLYPSTRR